jgi:hypothetical protein
MDLSLKTSWDEQVIINNLFGIVTDRRITYKTSSGNGSDREDIPLRHVTAVRIVHQRNVVVAILAAIVALIGFNSGEGFGISVGIFFGVLAVLSIIGHCRVVINTAGADHRSQSARAWHKKEAEEFAAAIRDQLFNRPDLPRE